MEDLSKLKNEQEKDVIEKACNYRKNGLDLKDSAKGIIFGGYLAPVIAVIILSTIFAMIITFSGMDYDTLIKTRPFDLLILLCAEFGFIGYFIYSFFISKRKKKCSDCLRVSFKNFDFLICIVVIILAIVMSILTSQFIDVVNKGLNLIGYDKSSSLPFKIDSVGNLMLGLVVMAIIPAVCEELLFRGIILGGLLNTAKNNKQRIICVVISALIFALVHQSCLQLFYPFIMGLLFGFIYMYTHNLIYGMILHFASNGFVIASNYYYFVNNISESAITYNASYVLGSIGLLLIALALAFGAVLLIKYITKDKSPFIVDEEKIKLCESEKIVNDLTETDVDEAVEDAKKEEEYKKTQLQTGKTYMLIAGIVGILILIYDFVITIVK